jgi:ADP-ribose pyrophosphatase
MALRADYVTSPSHPGGEPFRRLVLEHPGAAVVLAVDDEDRVVCLSQYRHAAQRRFVELPAGLCDTDGEDPLEVAQRELQEEVLLSATDWTHLTSTFSSPGISAERIHYYLARGLSDVSRGDFELEHEEADMAVFRVPFAELLAAVLDGRITDAPVIIAVLTAHARGLVGHRP